MAFSGLKIFKIFFSPPKPSKGRNGYVIYMVLVLMLVLSIYMGVMLLLRRQEMIQSQQHFMKLQATVMSYSGLNYAMAFAAGYEGGSRLWETPELKRVFGRGGAITISAHHEMGFLKVKSTGCFRTDTVVTEGVLGQSPPPICGNALSIGRSDNDIVIADYASVNGPIGTTGGKAITRNKGIFNGKISRLNDFDYSDDIMEREFAVFKRFPRSQQNSDSFLCMKPSKLDSTLRFSNGAVSTPRILINGGLRFPSTAINDMKSAIYIEGTLTIGQASKIRNLISYVHGAVIIEDSARLEHCAIVASGNLSIGGNVVFQGIAASAETLSVGGKSKVTYPSFLYLSKTNCNLAADQILILKDEAEVHGTVATALFKDLGSLPRIICGMSCRMEGFVVCPGAMTLYGEVKGSVYTGKIVYNSERTVYENWVREAAVSWRNLSLMTLPLLFLKSGILRYERISVVSGSLL
jgi:hypothetical protein